MPIKRKPKKAPKSTFKTEIRTLTTMCLSDPRPLDTSLEDTRTGERFNGFHEIRFATNMQDPNDVALVGVAGCGGGAILASNPDELREVIDFLIQCKENWPK